MTEPKDYETADSKLSNDDDAAEGPIVERTHAFEAAGGALGALSGAGMGAIVAGPPGAIAGAVIGAVMGASTGWAHESATREEAQHDKELDEQIGVSGGDIGVPGLAHPPSKTGVVSAEAAGAGSAQSGLTPSNGPIPSSD